MSLNQIERMKRRLKKRSVILEESRKAELERMARMIEKEEKSQVKALTIRQWLDRHGGRDFRDLFIDETGDKFILLYNGKTKIHIKKFLPHYLTPQK